ncbi:MAG TPA: zinc-ribbon domain-containing protein, partial [Solirubrobacteraceae bacterium]|nr:zinc-ribbon domain-containing protein [Solirubrobacteraceae bacterium]
MAVHCTECGFLNSEGANYCQRCGALIERAETAGGEGDPITATY